MKGAYHIAFRRLRLTVCLTALLSFATAVCAVGTETVVEWDFSGIAAGKTTDITASYCASGFAVSALTTVAGTNNVGVVSSSLGSYKVPGSSSFLSPAYEIGMSTTTTTLNSASFSLNFRILVEAGTCLQLSRLTFTLGYDTDYNLPGEQYYAPSSRLYISTNGLDWTAVAGVRTPTITNTSEFSSRSAGAYFTDAGKIAAFPENTLFTEGTTVYFRLALAEEMSSLSDRRRIVIDNIKLEGQPGAEDLQHVVVFHNVSEFAGWPANNGLWRWGNEILVGFDRWTYNATNNPHNQSPFIAYYYARSHDGGLTWTGEEKPANVAPAAGYNFEGYDFGIRLWKENYFLTGDRAASWGGPVALPQVGGRINYARSNYIVTGTNSALLFISTEAGATNPARSYVAGLTNGTVSFLSWVGTDLFAHAHSTPEPDAYSHSIMPSGVRVAGDYYICAVRQRIDNDRWSDIYGSSDGGRTWSYMSELEQGSDNPVSLVSLGGHTVAAVYGWCKPPYGLRAKISYNAGYTWSEEIILRDDGLNDDIGYTRATVNNGGSVVILYYYATADMPEQHIAATIWKPRKVGVVQHGIVYHNAGEFAGWPANGGLWMWGDELLVGFERWTYEANPSDRHHAQNPFIAYYYSRSRDGGLTWIGEAKPPNVTPAASYNFQGTNFAIRLWKENYFLSSNRAASWGGPVTLPLVGGRANYARSNYIITGTNSALFFISTDESSTNAARSYVARMTNGTVSFLSWVGTDLFTHAHSTPAAGAYSHSIMPSAVRISGDHYVCAVRQRIDDDRWSDIYESSDGGRNWNYISELEQGSDNPVALVSLGGNTLAAIYGWRLAPYGLRAKISYNAGHTWSDHIILRDDGLNDDIGYTRAVVRSDGAIVILYYYATAAVPEQHIAVTVWRPAGAQAASEEDQYSLAFGVNSAGIISPSTSFTKDEQFALTFYAAHAYANYTVDVSSNLFKWEQIPLTGVSIPGYVTITNKIAGPAGFIRLRATFTP